MLLQIFKCSKTVTQHQKISFLKIHVFSKLKWISRRFEVINYNYEFPRETWYNRLIK